MINGFLLLLHIFLSFSVCLFVLLLVAVVLVIYVFIICRWRQWRWWCWWWWRPNGDANGERLGKNDWGSVRNDVYTKNKFGNVRSLAEARGNNDYGSCDGTAKYLQIIDCTNSVCLWDGWGGMKGDMGCWMRMRASLFQPFIMLLDYFFPVNFNGLKWFESNCKSYITNL